MSSVEEGGGSGRCVVRGAVADGSALALALAEGRTLASRLGTGALVVTEGGAGVDALVVIVGTGCGGAGGGLRKKRT
jgi:hypothetical protein